MRHHANAISLQYSAARLRAFRSIKSVHGRGATGGGGVQRLRLILICMCMAAAPVATRAGEDIDTPGLLVNQTRTFAGQEFFSAFAEQWQGYDPDSRYSIVITERPSARTGSQITVTYIGAVVYQRFISFNATFARHAGQEATMVAFNAVTAAELDRQLPDPDLGVDEVQL